MFVEILKNGYEIKNDIWEQRIFIKLHFYKKEKMSNRDNRIISFDVEHDEHWAINEATPNSLCVFRLKTSLFVVEFVRLKEIMHVENNVEAEYGIIFGFEESNIKIIILPCLQKETMTLKNILDVCESKASRHKELHVHKHTALVDS